jgi:hypothetical protein
MIKAHGRTESYELDERKKFFDACAHALLLEAHKIHT